MYFLPSLQTQTASWFWISHFPLLQPVHVKLLQSVEVWKNWNTFLAFFSYYLNIGLKNNALDKGQSIMQTSILSSKIWKTFYFHFVIKVKCGNNKENNIKAWHPYKKQILVRDFLGINWTALLPCYIIDVSFLLIFVILAISVNYQCEWEYFKH